MNDRKSTSDSPRSLGWHRRTTRTAGTDKATLNKVLFRLLSHQSGNTSGMSAIDNSIMTKGATLHSGKHDVKASAVISRQSSHGTARPSFTLAKIPGLTGQTGPPWNCHCVKMCLRMSDSRICKSTEHLFVPILEVSIPLLRC